MIGQTITVINKSGKVVSSSKHIVNVFKEAKSAYRERKAEIKATREADDKKLRHALKHTHLDDGDRASRVSRSRSTRHHHGHEPSRRRSVHHGATAPPLERGVTDSFYANDVPAAGGHPSHPWEAQATAQHDFPRRELARRHTEGPALALQQQYPQHRRHSSDENIDMDLAYGELPPPLPVRRSADEQELRGRFVSLQQLLDEANCVQHSVTAMIERLQKDPEALAAVALALAEISNIAGKMAPGALGAMKGAFPAVMALLASPQFLIAAGVGVGVTVVALGGYKIIKKIQADKKGGDGADGNRAVPDDQLQELDVDVSRIERWRHGIADAEADSVGTTVDGEFITPNATRRLLEEGVIRQDDIKSTRSGRSRRSVRSSRSKASASSKTAAGADKAKSKKKKEPSGLRMLFKPH